MVFKGYITYSLFFETHSFNLGDGGNVVLESNQTTLNEWQTVEIKRVGRQGTLIVNRADRVQVTIFSYHRYMTRMKRKKWLV